MCRARWRGTALPFTYGDLDGLERLFAANKGEVAAVMMEAMRFRTAAAGLPGSGESHVPTPNDALFILDEVSSGWRLALGSAQEWLGVTPDISTFAKSMSNGYAMGCVVGSRAAMEPASRMFVSSSYWSENRRPGRVDCDHHRAQAPQRPRRVFGNLARSCGRHWQKPIDAVGIAASVTGVHTMPTLAFDLPDPALKKPIETLFMQEMVKRGIFCHMAFTATLAHTNEDIALTAAAAAEALEIVKRGMAGELDALLESEAKREPLPSLGAVGCAAGVPERECRPLLAAEILIIIPVDVE